MELEASGLQIGYGEHVIVNQMDVSIARDKITTIIGPNGSGKSTLLKALTRLIRYQKGNVLLDGCDIQTMKPKALAKKLGVLPQIHTAPSDFRVKELVGYGRMPHQKLMTGKSKEDEEVIRWAMEVTGTWKFPRPSQFTRFQEERRSVCGLLPYLRRSRKSCSWMSQRPIWTFLISLRR